MLSTLRLHNFIVIEEQTVQFDEGFTALSGESGAGKSVLVRALDFVCGGKLSLSPIRSDKLGDAEVEAQFTDVASLDLVWLEPGTNEGSGEIVLRRTFSSNGRTRGWVNGRLVTQAQLQELAEHLISITSQSQSVRLRHPAVQRAFFDSFAGARELAEEIQREFTELTRCKAELARIQAEAEQTALKKSSLDFIVEELTAANISDGCRAAFEQELKALSAGTKLQAQLSELSQMGVEAGLARALTIARELNPELSSTAESVKAQWDDLFNELMRGIKSRRADPAAQERISEQLAEVARLERKYRTNDAGLVSMLERVKQELATIAELPDPSSLEAEIRTLAVRLKVKAEKLSAKRAAASKKLATALQTEFKDLGLESLALAVRLTPLEEITAHGLERVEFVMHLRGQASSEGVALGTSASGGELSRIFLALMVATGGGTSSDTLVFDEIDSGVSGQAARVVGDKLRKLGEHHQVLCVTHLAQVASLATSNLRVTKTPGIPPGSTVERLGKGEKVEEIARMLAGYVVTDQARKSADELISSK